MGQTRNYGAERSEGEYLIILDSDVILPEGYFDAVEKELTTSPADAFGGTTVHTILSLIFRRQLTIP